ncbi:MAG: HDOD domain-containing protein [Candidatus Latescibacterota bacterium]
MAADRETRDCADYALILQPQQGKPQQILVRYLTLLLNYRYGLDIIVVRRPVEAFSTIQRLREQIRCTFVVQNRNVDSRSSVAPLNIEGSIPLFLLLPRALIDENRRVTHRMENVHFCSWEAAFSQGSASLVHLVAEVFEEQGIGDLFVEAHGLHSEESQQRLEYRLRNLRTLPTIPEVALRILQMVEDPRSTVEELERMLTPDPAVVHKLLQVVTSSLFAGTSGRQDWTLHEAIVRLGRKQVGAIALQIKLMNSLVRPEESRFDLRRFWRHSAGCALIADRVHEDRRAVFATPMPFDSYWIASLLHDIGMLVLGFFFWSHFEEVVEAVRQQGKPLRRVEMEMGDFANHEFLGRSLLENSRVGGELLEAVSLHDTVGEDPSALVSLVHVADNLSLQVGLGYLPEETPHYAPAALRRLQLDLPGVNRLAESLGEGIGQEVDELVERCLDRA